MNVKIFGFEWILGVPETDLSLADFLRHLRLQSGVPTADKKHVFAIQEKDGFLVGVVVGIKDYKRYCQLKERKVTAQELEEGTTFVDVNFFLIHPNTGKGLYQYYFHSTSVNYFGVLCQFHYRQLKQSLGITKRGTLKQIVLTRPENFIEAAERLTAIKSITVEQVSYDFREKNFQPIAKAADRIVERAVFWRPSKQQAVKDAVMGFLRERIGGVKNAKLVGVDPSEQEVTLKLLHDYDVFQEYDYDDFIKNVSLDMDDFATTINESSNIESLISIAQKTPIKELLEVPPKRPPAKKKK